MLGVRGSSGERNNQQCNGDNNSQSCAQDKEWRGEIVARPHQREESDRQGRNRERGGPHDNFAQDAPLTAYGAAYVVR